MDVPGIGMESHQERWNELMTLRKLVSDGKVSGSALVSNDGTRATFVCDCGNKFSRALGNSVKSSTVQCLSCTNTRPFAGERHIFKRIKSDAVRAGREFNLTLEFFVSMCHEPCHYCNRSNINSANVPSKTGGFLIEGFRYNGLDRVDNTLGYDEDNCVPCCVVCNRAKNAMPFDEFMEYIQSLVGYQNSIGDGTNEYRNLRAERVHDRRGPSETGQHSGIEELQEDHLPVSSIGPVGEDLDRGTVQWGRGFIGGPYRNIEGTV